MNYTQKTAIKAIKTDGFVNERIVIGDEVKLIPIVAKVLSHSCMSAVPIAFECCRNGDNGTNKCF